MSGPRLLFLYPPLTRSIRGRDAQIALSPITRAQPAICRRRFHNAESRRQETFAQRYGPAAEQLPPSPPPKESDQNKPVIGEKMEKKDGSKKAADKKTPSAAPPQEETSPAVRLVRDTTKSLQPSPLSQTAKSSELEAEAVRQREKADSLQRERSKNASLETVLHMEPPTSKPKEEEHKPPHLHAPPYVHHFDTYSLVKDLEKGGWTGDQSVTLMKAVRGLLAVNLDVARDGLVSKSDVENVPTPPPPPPPPFSSLNFSPPLTDFPFPQENYLFRAACSELRTEISNLRRSSSEKMRTERAHLQHEVDILSQKLTQDLAALKDELKSMFNDRKMAVRMEQRSMESAIQELNYKITVALNSDSKGEVEGLRWVLTRRAAMAIAGMAILILASLRYTTYMIHLQDEERKRMERETNNGKTNSGTGAGTGGGAAYTTPSREMGTQTGEGGTELAAVNTSYVSLG